LTPRDALGWISDFKQRLETPDPSDGVDSPEDETRLVLWNRYHDTLQRANAVDFDDLLVLPAKILQEHEDVRRRFHDRFQYIHVDEYKINTGMNERHFSSRNLGNRKWPY